MYTQTITVKIDKRTNESLDHLAREFNKGKSEVVRQAINNFVKRSTLKAGESLVKMSLEAKKYKYQAPEDVVANHNKYLYGKS